MFIKTASVTTKIITMEHISTKEITEKNGIRKQNPKGGKKEERIRSKINQKHTTR